MRKIATYLISTCLVSASAAYGLTVEVQKFEEGEPAPAGYQDVSTSIDASAVIDVSSDPFVDYLIPNNSGSAGITAQKDDGEGEFIVESSIADLDGANNGIDPDRFQVVFEWTDGDPLPFGADFYGVSWGGWSATAVETLTTRINLSTEQEVTVYHWFNDGWDYTNHDVLAGHNLTVTHYDAGGGLVAEQDFVLASGGAESFFGDHRQFYSAIVKATRTAEGDYLIITNEGGNIGYKGTAVAVEAASNMGPGEFSDFELQDGWVNTAEWMGWVYVDTYPWIFSLALEGYLYAGGSGWFYAPR